MTTSGKGFSRRGWQSRDPPAGPTPAGPFSGSRVDWGTPPVSAGAGRAECGPPPGGGAVGPAAPGVGGEVVDRADAGGPALAALVVQGEDVLDLVAGPHRVHLPADDGQAGVAGAGVAEGPGQRR